VPSPSSEAGIGLVGVLVLALGWLSPPDRAWAQQTGSAIGAEAAGIGKATTRIERFDHALGIVTTLRRPTAQLRLPSASEIECYGLCLFANGNQGVAWQCAPDTSCELHCTVNPPVGGCR
jgi:hypothetical protein